MSTHHPRPRRSETVVPFFKSLGIVAIFSPWLLLIYLALTSYTANLYVNDQEVIRDFIEWFGTAYSFFLALAIVNVWSQFETVDRELDRELDAVATLLQTEKYTGVSNKKKQKLLDEFKTNVHQDIRDYLTHVIDNHKFEHQVAEQHRNGDRILETIGRRIGDLASGKAVPEPFINELFKSLNEAIDVRGDRIAHSKPYTPVIIQLVALTASLIWLLSFLGLVIYDKWVALVLIGGVAFVIIMVLVIFFDLGEPFGGIWKIHLDDWSEFLEVMDHDEDPHVVFVYNSSNSLAGRWRAFTGKEICKLKELTRSKARGHTWEPFVQNIERPRPNGHPRIKCLTFYHDQLKLNGLPLKTSDWPVVVLKQGGKREVFLDSQQIESCTDLHAFEALFHERLKERLDWYEQ